MTQPVVNAGINLTLNATQAIGALRGLQAAAENFNQSVLRSNQEATRNYQDTIGNFRKMVEQTGHFATGFKEVSTAASHLGDAIDRNKMSLGQFYKTAMASSQKFSRFFRTEARTIDDLALARAKKLKTQYMSYGQMSGGKGQALFIEPLKIENQALETAIQKRLIFNKVLAQGNTALINWGKNVQWAGRQTLVGFTLPLTVFATVAGKAFKEIEMAEISFKRVYGDLETTAKQSDAASESLKELAKDMTKYGIAIKDTIGLGAKVAATGMQGNDMIIATKEATRLATLGQIDQQQALDATISLQSAFLIQSKDLAEAIDFLNAVENQTVTSLEDITTAIPVAAPAIRGLGGDVKDLAVMLTAMREGGVSASEGANALKSGMASLINPTKNAIEMAERFNIDLQAIAQNNKGDVLAMVQALAVELEKLDGFSRQQVINKIFGKYQSARMSALFQNIVRDGSQASQVMELVGKSTAELAALSNRELGKIEDAVSVKFTAALERLKAEIAPIGEMFMRLAIPVIDVLTGMAKAFNDIPDVGKTIIMSLVLGLGAIIPAGTMVVGLLANLGGQFVNIMHNVGKFISVLWRGKSAMDVWVNTSELDAVAAQKTLGSSIINTAEAVGIQRQAMQGLLATYRALNIEANALTAQYLNQPGVRGGLGSFRNVVPITRLAKGEVNIVPGYGGGDIIPAMIEPGESVINKKSTKKYAALLSLINGDKVPGFVEGRIGTHSSHFGGSMEKTLKNILAVMGFGDKGKAWGVLNALDPSAASIKNGLWAELPGKLNSALGKGQGFGVDEFEYLWNSVGSRKFLTSAERATRTGGSGVLGRTVNWKDELGEAGLVGAFDRLDVQVLETSKNLAKLNGGVINQTVLDEAMQQGLSQFAGGSKAEMEAAKIMRYAEATPAQARISPISKNSRIGAMLGGNISAAELKKLGIDPNTTMSIRESPTAKGKVGAYLKTSGMSNKVAQRGGAHVFDLFEDEYVKNPDGSYSFTGFTRDKSLDRNPIRAGELKPKSHDSAQYKNLKQLGVIMSTDASDSLVSGVKSGLKINSPSLEMNKLGQMSAQGFIEGFRGGLETLKGVTGKFGEEVNSLYTANKAKAIPGVKGFVSVANQKKMALGMSGTKEILGRAPQIKAAAGNISMAVGSGKIHIEDRAYRAEVVRVMNKVTNAMGEEMLSSIPEFNAIIDRMMDDMASGVISGGKQVNAALRARLDESQARLDESRARSETTIVSSPSQKKRGTGLAKVGKAATLGLMAMDGIVFALSMLGGPIGEFAGSILPLVIGISSVTSMLSMFGIGLSALLGPLAVVAGAVGLVVGGVMLYNHIQEEARKKIQGLGDAAEFSKEQIESMAQAFGYNARETVAFSSVGKTDDDREAAIAAKTYIQDNEDLYKEELAELTKTTSEQAKATLLSMFTDIIASGAPREVALAIVDQLAQKAGLKDIVGKTIAPGMKDMVKESGEVKNWPEYIKTVMGSFADLMKAGPSEAQSYRIKALEFSGQKNNVQNDIRGVLEGSNSYAALNQIATDFDLIANSSSRSLGTIEDFKKALDELSSSGGVYVSVVERFHEANMSDRESLEALIPLLIKRKKYTDQMTKAQKAADKAQTDSTRNVFAAQRAVGNLADLLRSELGAGLIKTQEEFDSAAAEINLALGKMTDTEKIDAVKMALNSLNPDLAALPVEGVGNVGDAFGQIAAQAGGAEAMVRLLNLAMMNADSTDIQNAISSAVVNGNVQLSTLLANILTVKGELGGLAFSVPEAASSIRDPSVIMGEIANAKAAAKQSKPSGGGGGGGGGGGRTKYDKERDRLAKANARLDLKEIRIDKSVPGRLRKELNTRLGQTKLTVDGVNFDLTSMIEFENALARIEEIIDDIEREKIKPIEDSIDNIKRLQEELNRQIELWEQAITEIEERYASILDPLEQAKEAEEERIRNIEYGIEVQKKGNNEAIAALEIQLDMAKRNADLQNQLLDDQIEKNNDNVELIEAQIDAIDKQIDALDEVAKINQIIANQNKGQLDIAQALSSGDTGAAASAMLASQQQGSQDAGDLQTGGFEKQKENLQGEIDYLGRQNDLLSKRKTAIDDAVDAISRQIAGYEHLNTLLDNSWKMQKIASDQYIANLDAQIAKMQHRQSLEIQYYQNLINSVQPKVREYENQIYVLEQQIEKIRRSQIKPLEDQKLLLEDIKDDVQMGVDLAKQDIEKKREQLRLAGQLNDAMETLKKKAAAAGGGGGAGSISDAYKKALDNVKKLEEELKVSNFKADVEQGFIVRDKGGGIRKFKTTGEVDAFMKSKEGIGSTVLKPANIEAGVTIGGKPYKGDSAYRELSKVVGKTVTKDVKVNLQPVAPKMTSKMVGNELVWYVNGKRVGFSAARGGFPLGYPGGGILPGFRGVAHGDDQMVHMRSGEGVTVSEALRGNKYESGRLLALNKAALSGNWKPFYKEYGMPSYNFGGVVGMKPVSSSQNSSSVVYNGYKIEVNVPNTNASPDEIANAVMFKIKENQRGQIRRY